VENPGAQGSATGAGNNELAFMIEDYHLIGLRVQRLRAKVPITTDVAVLLAGFVFGECPR